RGAGHREGIPAEPLDRDDAAAPAPGGARGLHPQSSGATAMTGFEHEKLLARWIAGEPLEAAEVAALKTALENDPAFLDEAAEQVTMDRLLEHRVVGAADFPGRVA